MCLFGPPSSALEHNAAAYIQSQMVNADRPTAQLNLGNYNLARRELDLAESAYSKAIAVDSSFIAAHVNLADLYRSQGKDPEARDLLLEAIQHAPGNAEAHHALGLLYVRQQQPDKAKRQHSSRQQSAWRRTMHDMPMYVRSQWSRPVNKLRQSDNYSLHMSALPTTLIS